MTDCYELYINYIKTLYMYNIKSDQENSFKKFLILSE